MVSLWSSVLRGKMLAFRPLFSGGEPLLLARNALTTVQARPWAGARKAIHLESQFDQCKMWLEVLRLHDSVLYQHSIFVSELTAAFSSYLGFAEEDQVLLTRAPLLHDIGKTAIPIQLLNKPMTCLLYTS